MSVALTPPLPTPPGGREERTLHSTIVKPFSAPERRDEASLAIHAGLAQNGNILYDCLVSHQTRTRMPVTMSTARKRVGRPARSEAEREVKRQAILDAALEVFSEKGYAATRLDDVAARAGVAKGTIYLYVSSKQELFEDTRPLGHRRRRSRPSKRGCSRSTSRSRRCFGRFSPSCGPRCSAPAARRSCACS